MWLTADFITKGHDFESLILKVVAKCGDMKLMANAIKFDHGAKDLNITDCALEGSEFHGSTKRKLNFLKSAHCDSHWFDQVNYSILYPNTRVKKACVEESLDFAKDNITRVPSTSTKRC